MLNNLVTIAQSNQFQQSSRRTTVSVEQAASNFTTADSGPSINIVQIVIIAVLLALIVLAAYWGFKKFARGVKTAALERMSLKTEIFEVRLPQTDETEISAADQLYSGLTGIGNKVPNWKRRFTANTFVSFEVVAFPDSIRFYVVTPKKLSSLVEKQINAAYPSAEIVPTKEYNIFPEGSKVAYAGMKLKDETYKPIKTYEELNTDSMSVVTGSMSKLKKGEAVVMQVVITPAGSDWRNEGKKFVSKVRENNADPEKSKMNVDEDVLMGIEKKCEKPGFYADVRLVAVGKTEDDAKANLSALTSSLDQFSKEGCNNFTKVKVAGSADAHEFIRDFIYRIPRESSILNTAELSTIFHLPNQTVRTPHINWLLSKRAPAGGAISSVYTEGSVHMFDSVYRDSTKKVYLKLNDRRRHTYIVGKTGAGKTNYMQRMILQDIYNGNGLAFLDPHGDSCEYILERIPPERAEDVIYFNPADRERPLGFNIMEYADENEKYLIVESFLGLLNKMFDPHNQGITGPRFQQSVRNAMLTAMVEPKTSLVEVVRIITDEKYVKKFLPKITDDVVRRYWTDQIANTNEFHKSEILGHITSKFEKFVTNKFMRNMIGQAESGFNIRHVMDNKKILLVNLSKGLIGEENSQFLGLLLVPKILRSAMQRADIPEKDRKDFFLYVDEFQNFATEDFAQILSEARKYRLNLVVANQYIAQMDEKIRDAVFGNVGTIVSFKVGVNDASYLQNEFSPVFDQNDLINLENYNVYTKMLIDGEYPPPFSAKIPYDPDKFPEYPEVTAMVKELSRLRYGRDRGLVEAEIAKRADLHDGVQADASMDKKPAAGGFGGMGGGFDTPLKAADSSSAVAGASGSTNSAAPAPSLTPNSANASTPTDANGDTSTSGGSNLGGFNPTGGFSG